MVSALLLIPTGTNPALFTDSTKLTGSNPLGTRYIDGLPVGALSELSVDVTLASLTGGTMPTATYFIDRLGLDGVWYQIATSGVIAAAGGTWSTTLSGYNSVSQGFGSTIRLRQTLTGGPTGGSFSASIIGKG